MMSVTQSKEAKMRRRQALQHAMGYRTCEVEVAPETMTASCSYSSSFTMRHQQHQRADAAAAASARLFCIFPMDDLDDVRDPENVLRVMSSSSCDKEETAPVPWDTGRRAAASITLHFGRERIVSRVRLQCATTAMLARHEVWLDASAASSSTAAACLPHTTATTALLAGVYEGPVEKKAWIEIDLLQLDLLIDNKEEEEERAAAIATATATATATAKTNNNKNKNKKNIIMLRHLVATGLTVRTTSLSDEKDATVAWYAIRVDELQVFPSFITFQPGEDDDAAVIAAAVADDT